MRRGNEPVIPQSSYITGQQRTWHGLTKREYFAGQALTGLLASGEWHDGGTVMRARLFADALLAELRGAGGEDDEQG